MGNGGKEQPLAGPACNSVTQRPRSSLIRTSRCGTQTSAPLRNGKCIPRPLSIHLSASAPLDQTGNRTKEAHVKPARRLIIDLADHPPHVFSLICPSHQTGLEFFVLTLTQPDHPHYLPHSSLQSWHCATSRHRPGRTAPPRLPESGPFSSHTHQVCWPQRQPRLTSPLTSLDSKYSPPPPLPMSLLVRGFPYPLRANIGTGT